MTSLIEKMRLAREKSAKLAEELSAGDFFVLPEGTTKIRLLPSVEFMKKLEEDSLVDDKNVREMFYKTFTFHFVPTKKEGKKGKYVFSHRKYEVEEDGKTVSVKCPIDEFASLCYENKDKRNAMTYYNDIKRKRMFLMNALVYDKDDNPKLVVLQDKSNDGALVKFLCSLLGEDFVLDTNLSVFKKKDEEKKQASDEVETYDILSIEDGRPIQIQRKNVQKMIDKGGKKEPITVPDYSGSKVMKNPRPLSAIEMELYENRPALSSLVKMEDDYNAVEKIMEEYIVEYNVDIDALIATAPSSKVDRPEVPREEKVQTPKETPAQTRVAPVLSDLDDDEAKLLEEFTVQ